MPWKPKSNMKSVDRARASSTRRGYGRAHRKLRLLVLARDPLCKLCHIYRPDRPANPSTQADHIDASLKGQDLLENLQGACAHCNNRKNNTKPTAPRA